MRLAKFFKVYYSMATFHIRRIFSQMDSANIFQTIHLGATMLAYDRGVVGNFLDDVCHRCSYGDETDIRDYLRTSRRKIAPTMMR